MDVAYIFLAALIFIMYSVTLWLSSHEGFENESSLTYEDPQEIYDDIYASIYDLIWHSKDAVDYQSVSIQDLSLADSHTTDVRILDMCCGTAPLACFFKNLNVDYVGVDISEPMLQKAREKCSLAEFKKNDISQIHIFPPKSMSHCLLLGFSVYQFENPKILSDNAYHWLKPGGHFIVHVVDPDKYDPIHSLSSPFAAFSLQKYNIERQTESQIYFDKFKYIGRLNKEKDVDNAVYQETFSYYDPDDNGGVKYRENKHHWNMPSKERLTEIFKSSGFRPVEMVDLVRCGNEYQYLAYFTK